MTTAEKTIRLTARPMERVDADIAVAGFFADDRPLRSGAARADWRLCGGLSRRIESGDLSGKSGEAMLIGCGRALRAPRLMLLGLGDRVRSTTRFGSATRRERRSIDVASCDSANGCTDAARGSPRTTCRGTPLRSLREFSDAWQSTDSSRSLEVCVPRSEVPGAFRRLRERARRGRRRDDFAVADDSSLGRHAERR